MDLFTVDDTHSGLGIQTMIYVWDLWGWDKWSYEQFSIYIITANTLPVYFKKWARVGTMVDQ